MTPPARPLKDSFCTGALNNGRAPCIYKGSTLPPREKITNGAGTNPSEHAYQRMQTQHAQLHGKPPPPWIPKAPTMSISRGQPRQMRKNFTAMAEAVNKLTDEYKAEAARYASELQPDRLLDRLLTPCLLLGGLGPELGWLGEGKR